MHTIDIARVVLCVIAFPFGFCALWLMRASYLTMLRDSDAQEDHDVGAVALMGGTVFAIAAILLVSLALNL